MVAGLAAALDYIREMGGGDVAAGREALIDNAETAAEMTRAAAQGAGLALFAAEPCAALTAILRRRAPTRAISSSSSASSLAPSSPTARAR